MRLSRAVVRAGLISGAVTLLPLCAPSMAAGAPPAPVDALVLERAGSPVLAEVRERLGRRLRVVRATGRRLRHPHRFDVLIVDGHSSTPAELDRAQEAIDEFVAKGGAALMLDVSSADFRRSLNAVTGFHAPRRRGGRASEALLVRRSVANGVPRMEMLDLPQLAPRGRRLSAQRRRAAERKQADRFGALVAREVRKEAGPAPEEPSATAAQAGGGIPPDVQHVGWTYREVGSSTPRDPYWTQQTRRVFQLITPPARGRQTASWTMTHQFDVYLDNGGGNPEGNFQEVTYSLNGQFAPKGNAERFQYMFEPFQIDCCTKFMERAWWTAYASQSVEPDEATDKRLVWEASAPSTPNAETTYTSGNSFEIGFSASKSEGPGISASYSVSNERSNSVPDWGVENQGSGNFLQWLFSARNNCDVRTAAASAGCFQPGFPSGDRTPREPNPLSLGQLQLNASGRWRTRAPLDTPSKGLLTFTVWTYVTLADTFCLTWDVFQCDNVRTPLFRTGPGPRRVSFDVSKVVPVGVKDVTLTPNPANGAANQTVTGTVTLKRPARMDTGTNVTIYSDSPNAVVGPPVGGGQTSKTTITIPEGETKGTFTVRTNDNRLKPGERTTAQITAFYSDSTISQLVVNGRPK
jgi:hypothetical protein